MSYREQLNQQYHQQAVQFAQQFTTPEDKQAWLSELTERRMFEQTQLEQSVPQTSQKRPLIPVLLACVSVMIGGIIYYWHTGRYPQYQQGITAFHQFQQQKTQENSQQRNEHYIILLQNRLREDPNNGELWFELGQAYSLNNEFESALHCFDYAQRLLGRKAMILGAMATADYYQNKQVLSAQGKKWINQALEQDPKESTSLLLLASEAFLHNDFEQAIQWWESVLESDNQAIDRRAVIHSIEMARERLNK